ncbi:MAG: hypothetical protein K6F70_07840 [Eggerthellaceae bacterium]|nr:hypothetical protein [Eggerthellaceae bacterium]
MPRITQEESEARREEIVDSCERLYASLSYRDITMTQIAAGVSFGRANMYNYFRCADEVLLALLQREHARWAAALEELADRCVGMADAELAQALAHTVEQRTTMLKMLAMNLYDMEQNSRLERLVEFKRTYAQTLAALRSVIRTAKPAWGEERVSAFVFAFMPFLHGAYPYAHHTEKQEEAMREAGVDAYSQGLFEIVRSCVFSLLQGE